MKEWTRTELTGRMVLGAIATICVLGPASASGAPNTCDERRQEVEGGNTLKLTTCGTTKCPESVKYAGTIGNPATLPKGYFVYNTPSGELHKSPLNQFKPEKIASGVRTERPMNISNDGERILFGVTAPRIIRKDGSDLTPVSFNGDVKFAYVRGEDKYVHMAKDESKPEYKVGEYDVVGKFTVKYSNMNSGSGAVTGGTQEVGYRAHESWLQAAKDYVFTTTRAEPARYGSFDNIAVLFDRKKGKSEPIEVNPMYPWSCGLTLSWDAKYTLANYGNAYQDCFPEGHKGFGVIPVDQAGKGAKEEWMSNPGVSVNWAPKEYKGYNLHKGNWSDGEFHRWNFTNHSDWVVGIHDKQPPYGVWLVNWRNNVWYPVAEDDVQVKDLVAAYFEELPPATNLSSQPLPRGTMQSGSGSGSGSGISFDFLGRTLWNESIHGARIEIRTGRAEKK